MLLRSSISDTKKFFQKTLQNFKSFFTPGYRRLPKSPPHSHFSYSVSEASVTDMNDKPSYKNSEKFYSDFTDQRDSDKDKAGSKKETLLSSSTKQEKEVYNRRFISAIPVHQKNQMEKREEFDNKNGKRSVAQHRERHKKSTYSSTGLREQRNYVVEQKLRELEMLDMGNVDYVLDIEEVLHYYSRLTCPAYVEIVDKFFMEMSSELFGPAWPASRHSINSRPKPRSVRSQACICPVSEPLTLLIT